MKTIVLLDRIRSMHNVGAFFRTCDGAGVQELILTGYTAYPPRNEISKTALDADMTVPWRYFKDPSTALKVLKNEGYRIIGVEKNEKSRDFREVHLREDEAVCFVFGNEVEGVSPEILEQCEEVIHLPMKGVKESLNVSVAGGALLYHFI